MLAFKVEILLWPTLKLRSGGHGPLRTSFRFVSMPDEWLIRTEDWADRDFNDLEISVKRTAMAKPPPAKKGP